MRGWGGREAHGAWCTGINLQHERTVCGNSNPPLRRGPGRILGLQHPGMPVKVLQNLDVLFDSNASAKQGSKSGESRKPNTQKRILTVLKFMVFLQQLASDAEKH